MGKQAQLKRFRRWLRDRLDRGVAHPDAAESYYYVGMSISGPPEAFGLPPSARSGICSRHQRDGEDYGCELCYPPQSPVTVTAVDEKNGTITLSTASQR